MKNKYKIFFFLGICFLCISFFFLLKNRYEDQNAGKKASNTVEKLNEKISVENELETLETVNIDGYDYIGTIVIPTLQLELPIMSDWDYSKMKLSPCRYYGSILENNLVICAHAYQTFFGNIKKLQPGDLVILKSVNQDTYVYEVKEIEVLKPSDIEKMIESEFDLTLFTCTSDNQNRVTVRLNKI